MKLALCFLLGPMLAFLGPIVSAGAPNTSITDRVSSIHNPVPRILARQTDERQ
jgi:hypothetical protein